MTHNLPPSMSSLYDNFNLYLIKPVPRALFHWPRITSSKLYHLLEPAKRTKSKVTCFNGPFLFAFHAPPPVSLFNTEQHIKGILQPFPRTCDHNIIAPSNTKPGSLMHLPCSEGLHLFLRPTLKPALLSKSALDTKLRMWKMFWIKTHPNSLYLLCLYL